MHHSRIRLGQHADSLVVGATGNVDTTATIDRAVCMERLIGGLAYWTGEQDWRSASQERMSMRSSGVGF